MWVLILTFWAGSSFGQAEHSTLATAVAPGSYSTLAACNTAGEGASKGYNGGAKVEWTCVEQEPKL